jgi:hypothetical protein
MRHRTLLPVAVLAAGLLLPAGTGTAAAAEHWNTVDSTALEPFGIARP